MLKEIVLETRNLSKSFGDKLAVNNLNLQVEAGDIYGFLGPNGSGKTTTIRMVLNLIHPNQGEIILNGYDVHTDFKKAIAQVGAIVETPHFYTYLTGRQNLEQMAKLVPGCSKNRVDEVLRLVGLANRGKDKVKTYSLGMKQRLGLARALLNNPKLVILDEPTNGLDPQGMKEVRELITRLAKEEGITFFISTHLLYEVEQICNKVGILRRGTLLAHGQVQSLLNYEDEVVEVCTPSPEQVESLLSGISYVKAYELSKKGVQVRLEKGSSAKLNHLLVSKEITIDYLIPKNPSLENFFLEMTKGDEQIA